MSTTIDQKSYLQKYLSGPSKDKKKKKKKVSKGKGFKIIDDDLDLSKLRPLDGDELDIHGEGEDAPQIAGIIDERPEEVKKLEQFQTNSKWKVINQDDGFNSKLQIQEIKTDIKEAEKENELIFGKMYSDSEDEKKDDSDPLPPRKQSKSTDNTKTSKKPQNNSDSDFSPPRRNREPTPKRNNRQNSPKNSNKKVYDSDATPPRKHESQRSKERLRKPSRWGEAEQSSRHRSESPRRAKKRKSQSPGRNSKRKSPDSDMSPPRKSQKHKQDDSDASPPRRQKDSPKRRNRSPDSDASPPRKRKQSPDSKSKHNTDDRYKSNDKAKSRADRKSPDSDLSPPRKNKRQVSPSPPRKSRKHSPERNEKKRKHDSDSDLSPPRKGRRKDTSERYKRGSNSPPPSNKRMAKTLEGKAAGLQDAKQLRQENDAFRRREEEAFSKLADEVSGRNAQAVSRRSKRETSQEKQQLKEKAERQRELDEKYKKWSKGLKQIESQEARAQDYKHEAAKPLARHRGDRDLEARLRGVARDGDPMLRYIHERKRERGELPPEKPTYKGTFLPNRFNIRPGYRWDGVDRSNGYEMKFFDQQSKRKAQEEEAYKWSTEDL